MKPIKINRKWPSLKSIRERYGVDIWWEWLGDRGSKNRYYYIQLPNGQTEECADRLDLQMIIDSELANEKMEIQKVDRDNE